MGGYAWAASPIADNSHKQLVECSGKGTCDRKSGECQCYDGFWGEGCRRSACPNEFSGPDCSEIECPSTSDPLGGEGNEMGRDCSGRGTCDYSTGLCTCFAGYYGPMCQTQTVLG